MNHSSLAFFFAFEPTKFHESSFDACKGATSETTSYLSIIFSVYLSSVFFPLAFLFLLASITVSNGESFFDWTFSYSTFFSSNSFSSFFLGLDLTYYFVDTLSSFLIPTCLTGDEITSTFFASTDAAFATGVT